MAKTAVVIGDSLIRPSREQGCRHAIEEPDPVQTYDCQLPALSRAADRLIAGQFLLILLDAFQFLHRAVLEGAGGEGLNPEGRRFQIPVPD